MIRMNGVRLLHLNPVTHHLSCFRSDAEYNLGDQHDAGHAAGPPPDFRPSVVLLQRPLVAATTVPLILIKRPLVAAT